MNTAAPLPRVLPGESLDAYAERLHRLRMDPLLVDVVRAWGRARRRCRLRLVVDNNPKLVD